MFAKIFCFFFHFSLKTQNKGKNLNTTKEPPLLVTSKKILQISLVNRIKLAVDNSISKKNARKICPKMLSQSYKCSQNL